MDMIGDFNLLIADVSAAFGRYIKYHVRSETLSTATQQPTPSPRNAFEVMMAAQGIMHATVRTTRHPPPVIVKNKRDQLFNDLLSTIESRGLQWRPEEVHCGAATRAIQAIRDTLWYIDGSLVLLHCPHLSVFTYSPHISLFMFSFLNVMSCMCTIQLSVCALLFCVNPSHVLCVHPLLSCVCIPVMHCVHSVLVLCVHHSKPYHCFVYILVVDFNVTVNETFNEIHSNT